MNISFDKKRELIDFDMERGEDRVSFDISALEDIIMSAKQEFEGDYDPQAVKEHQERDKRDMDLKA